MRPVDLANLEPRLRIDENSVVDCIHSLENAGNFVVPEGSIEIAFVDASECSRLHLAFFDDPDVTDVMTFPGDPDDGHAGDIAICPEVAFSASRENGLPFAEELTLYLVHAWLHLGGLKDFEKEDRREMRKAEAILMEHLREKGHLLVAAWDAGASEKSS